MMQLASKLLAIGLIVMAGLGAGVPVIKSYLQTQNVGRAMAGGDPSHAPALLRRYGCAGCHTISGVPGADGQVGGSLDGIRQRVYVAGVAVNAPENLAQWIARPQTFSPRSAMPATGISPSEARDVAAFLYTR